MKNILTGYSDSHVPWNNRRGRKVDEGREVGIMVAGKSGKEWEEKIEEK